MIKLLIFDVDGVIVQSKILHELAFIQALNNHGISIIREYHKNNLKKEDLRNVYGICSDYISNYK